MSASTVRIIGILFLLSAAVLMVLNLKRVADMGTFWIGLPLLLIGVILVLRARKPS
jgi:hypothetical protein